MLKSRYKILKRLCRLQARSYQICVGFVLYCAVSFRIEWILCVWTRESVFQEVAAAARLACVGLN